MKTHGSAVWQGGIKDGKGAISTKSAGGISIEKASPHSSARLVMSFASYPRSSSRSRFTPKAKNVTWISLISSA